MHRICIEVIDENLEAPHGEFEQQPARVKVHDGQSTINLWL